ncbi:triose-phosphate isomerase [Patescibacteria group bacterium]|nr:triose-phosphate isomerase [Patescibacteria group bacterium]
MAKLIMFNWKMNPSSVQEAGVLAQASDHEHVVVVPPFPYLLVAGDMLTRAQLGAQDVFWENPPERKGSFTGEVSASQLKDMNVKYVIVGHSERRHKLHESDEVIAKKLRTAFDAGFISVLCVGETKEERAAGKTEEVITRQIAADLSLMAGVSIPSDRILLAYEPVWAIGTGDPETPAGAAKTIGFIRSVLRSQISVTPQVLYGGSVTGDNVNDFLKLPEIDGVLVGGASLKTDEIEKMLALL